MHICRDTDYLPGMDFDRKGSDKNLTFTRRYLDPNRVTYEVREVLSLTV